MTENLLKTVIFRIPDKYWVLAVTAGLDNIHYKKLGEAIGVNRQELRMASPVDIEQHLGYEIGGVGPFPVVPGMKIVFDSTLRQLDMIHCGSGRNTCTIKMNVCDLIDLVNGIEYDIVRLD